MNKLLVTSVFGLLTITSTISVADQRSIPVQIDYSLIKKVLLTQVYKGLNNSAELWNDRHGCGHLTLSNPELNGQQGQVRMINQVDAKVGTQLGGQCLTLLEWSGTLETLQQPTLDGSNSVLKFPITKATAYDPQGRQLTIDKLQDLIKRFAEPKLSEVKIDLNESRRNIEHTLTGFLPKENIAEVQTLLNSLKFNNVQAGDNGINVKLQFDAPNKLAPKKPEPAFNAAEQQQWQAAWQQWDEFLSSAIKQATNDTQSPEVRETLMEILMDSRAAFQAGLKDQGNTDKDPVRVFFTDTWVRLSPVLKTIGNELPGAQSLKYLTFIAATDVIYELESIGAPFGLDISSDGLRRLARLLIAGKQEAEVKITP